MMDAVMQATIDPSTWPWMVAGLVAAVTAISGLYNKVLLDRVRGLEAERTSLQEEVRQAMRERYESELAVVKMLERATDVLEEICK